MSPETERSIDGATRAIAEFVAATPDRAIPRRVRENAVHTLIDIFATTNAGVVEPASEVIRGALPSWAGRGRSSIFCSEQGTVDPASAALANGIAAHCLDYDTVSVVASAFIGTPAACAIAAWAEEFGPFTGREMVTAYCLGWEAAAAVARGVNIYHYAHGWHPTATLGHFSAALACARLARMDTEQMRHVIGVAVSEASGVKTMIGNMLNPFHVGKAARNGVTAVRLVAAGFKANTSALEADQGFLNVFNGAGNYDLEAIVSPLGKRWDLADPAPIFKMYPCCALIHSGIDAALALRTDHAIEPGEIQDVLVRVHEYVPRVMHVDVPAHGYAAKFSIPYCIASAFHDGRVDLGTFDQVDPGVVELGRRVHGEVADELRGPDTFMKREFTEVIVKTRRGTFTEHVDRMTNRGIGANFDPNDLRAKLDDCLRHGRSRLDAADEWSRLIALDSDAPTTFWRAA